MDHTLDTIIGLPEGITPKSVRQHRSSPKVFVTGVDETGERRYFYSLDAGRSWSEASHRDDGWFVDLETQEKLDLS